MTQNTLTDQLEQRIEQLLLRHAELQRANRQLQTQVEALGKEGNNLKSRLMAARSRIDELIDRMQPEAKSKSPQTQDSKQD